MHFAADGSGAVAVLGVLFEYAAEERPADATAERLLADVAADGGARRIKINPGALWDGTSGYFRWQGSLTTPPCTGGVSWVLQKETRTVSREAVARFREHLGDGAFRDARPTRRSTDGRCACSSRKARRTNERGFNRDRYYEGTYNTSRGSKSQFIDYTAT